VPCGIFTDELRVQAMMEDGVNCPVKIERKMGNS
jgi:hypothetical protein